METRRVAIVGGNRIPFARSGGAYARASNQDMLTAALDRLNEARDHDGADRRVHDPLEITLRLLVREDDQAFCCSLLGGGARNAGACEASYSVGGVSPLTPDFINPERPWPHVEQLRLRTEAKGFVLQQRLPVYPEFIPSLLSKPGLLADKLRNCMADDGLARRAA